MTEPVTGRTRIITVRTDQREFPPETQKTMARQKKDTTGQGIKPKVVKVEKQMKKTGPKAIKMPKKPISQKAEEDTDKKKLLALKLEMEALEAKISLSKVKPIAKEVPKKKIMSFFQKSDSPMKLSAKTTTKKCPKSTAKPDVRMSAKPTAKMMAQPAAKMMAKPAAKMMAKPPAKMMAKPEAKPSSSKLDRFLRQDKSQSAVGRTVGQEAVGSRKRKHDDEEGGGSQVAHIHVGSGGEDDLAEHLGGGHRLALQVQCALVFSTIQCTVLYGVVQVLSEEPLPDVDCAELVNWLSTCIVKYTPVPVLGCSSSKTLVEFCLV